MVSPKWEKVADIRLKGQRFGDRSVAARELQQLHRSVAETLAAFWLLERPDLQSSLSQLEERTDVQLLRVEHHGTSAAIRLSTAIGAEIGGQAPEMENLKRAFRRIWNELKLAAQSSQQPTVLPAALIALIAWGALLPEDGGLDVSPADEEPVRIPTASFRRWYSGFVSHATSTSPPPDFAKNHANEQSLDEVLKAVAAEVPDEEWQKLPSDLSYNLDHYLYGAPEK